LYSFDSPEGTFRLIHEWFAGWRWERWFRGVLRDESLRSFETKEDCASDAQSHAAAASADVLEAAA
jgi:hypothetical protein